MRTIAGISTGIPFSWIYQWIGLSWAITYLAVVVCLWTIFYMVQMNKELQDYKRRLDTAHEH